jgi:hypothetical protein
MGSAVPQKRIPVAIVVHKEMLNHFHWLRSGLASFPPILILAKGVK